MKQLLTMLVILIGSFTNAQTFLFSCDAPELIEGRTEELSALADNALYTHVESGFLPYPENYRYEIIVTRTNLDGTETEYFKDEITWTYLGNLDGSVQGGWDGFIAAAEQAVADSEDDGKAEFNAFTASRTAQIEAYNTANVPVTVEWDTTKGHVITIINAEILSSDYGHRNYGKSSQDDFDVLIRRIEEALFIQDPNAERIKRLAMIQSIASNYTNAFVERSTKQTADGDDYDSFAISYDEAIDWERTVSGIQLVENISRNYYDVDIFQELLNSITAILVLAQAEYDLVNAPAIATQRDNADATNSLLNQLQSEVTEESREAELNKLAVAGQILVITGYDTFESSHRIISTILGGNSEYLWAKNFGGNGDLSTMLVEDFNDYYAALWIFIDNN